MKKSKLFLAGVTCILAVSAVAATKAARFNDTTGYYQTSGTGFVTVSVPCATAGTQTCKYQTTDGTLVTVYNTKATDRVPILYKPE